MPASIIGIPIGKSSDVGLKQGTASTDAFGRLRISNPYTVFDSKQLYGKGALVWDEATSGGTETSLHSTTDASVTMTVNLSGEYVIHQTKRRFNYQPGKALKHGEPVLTTSGWKNIEDMEIGDRVFDGLGKETEVVGVYPQGVRPIYRITFNDKTTVDCDENHLWKTIIRQNSKKGKERILSTKEMLDEYGENPPNFARWRIPSSPVLELPYKEVPVDPYILGAILGDGHIYDNGYIGFTTADSEILNYMVCDGISKFNSSDYGYGLKGLVSKIKELKLEAKVSDTKFVPYNYLYNSKEVRLSILQGLMDTDGAVGKDGVPYFSSVSKDLAESVSFLVRSLGGQAKITKKKSGYKNKNGDYTPCKDSYYVTVISPVNPFKLNRKAILWKPRTRISFDKYIHTIKYLGEFEATCIRVASEDHTFLTRNNTVTHNSQLALLTFVAGNSSQLLRQVGLFSTVTTGTHLPKNGIFLQCENGVASLNIIKNANTSTQEQVIQSNWNVDRFDGTGPSGIDLDFTKTQIFFIDFEWLGVGTVRTGFVVDGKFYFAHLFHHANSTTSVYMSTPNLPITYLIRSTGGTGSMQHICSTIMSEGGTERTGISYAVTRGATGLTVASAGIRRYRMAGQEKEILEFFQANGNVKVLMMARDEEIAPLNRHEENAGRSGVTFDEINSAVEKMDLRKITLDSLRG